MKKIVNCYLNVRIGSPSVAASCIEYLAPGMTVEVKDSVAGSMIDGNNTWYRDEADNYYWSGGFQNDLFVDRLIGQLKKATISEFLTAESAALLQGITGIEGIGWTLDNEVFFVIIFYSGQTPEVLPTSIQIINGIDGVSWAPVKIEPTTAFKAHTDVLPGDFIHNKFPLRDDMNEPNKGSLGYFLHVIKEKKIMALTCYHVVRNNLEDFNIKDTTIPNRSFEMTLESLSSDFGNTLDGCIDDKLDAALIDLFDNVKADLRIPLIGKVNTPRDIDPSDINTRIAVRMFGAKSEFKQGTIIGIAKEPLIHYGSQNKKLHDLIVVKNQDGPFSEEGDSGSLVVDKNNAAIGIVVAGNKDHTLLIPILRILEKFKAELPK